MKRASLLVAFVMVLAVAAMAFAADFGGKWMMKDGEIEYTLELTQTDANLVGKLTFTDAAKNPVEAEVTGTVAESVATLEVKEAGKATLTLNADGTAAWAVTEPAGTIQLPAAGAMTK